MKVNEEGSQFDRIREPEHRLQSPFPRSNLVCSKALTEAISLSTSEQKPTLLNCGEGVKLGLGNGSDGGLEGIFC